MIVDIIKIGNSKGVRIPKSILELCGLMGRVKMHTQGNKLIIEPIRNRENWEALYKKNAKKEELEFISNKWDDNEWQW